MGCGIKQYSSLLVRVQTEAATMEVNVEVLHIKKNRSTLWPRYTSWAYAPKTLYN